MKKIGILFIGLFLLSLHTSCDRTVKVVDNTLGFDSLRIDEVYHLFNDENEPCCNLRLDFKFPDKFGNKEVLKKIQSIFIDKFLGNNYSDLSPEKALDAYKVQYIEEFKQFETEIKEEEKRLNEKYHTEDEDENVDETGFSYYLISKDTVLFNKNNILSFQIESSSYIGGAHGYNSSYAYVINLETGDLIKESHIFGEDTKEYISKLIIDKILKQNDLKDPKDLENIGYTDVQEIAPNGNFIVDEKGITYIFNEDEIAPRVVGRIKVFLPYEEISVYMKPENPLSGLYY